MPGVSGLSRDQRAVARQLTTHAALLALRHKDALHYTQSAERWEGIERHLVAARGEFPRHGDCSSIATWALWNGLFVPFGLRDVVNDLAWSAGYTGTLAQNGREVTHEANMRRGDLVLYGPPPVYSHVAIVVGRKNGKPVVVSNGSEPGPFLLPWDYRTPSIVRRYI